MYTYIQPWFQNNVAFYVSYFWLYRMLTLGQIRLNWIQWNKRKKTWNLLIILKSYHSVCWIHRQVQLNDAKHQWMSLQWRKSWNNKWHMSITDENHDLFHVKMFYFLFFCTSNKSKQPNRFFIPYENEDGNDAFKKPHSFFFLMCSLHIVWNLLFWVRSFYSS